MLHFIGAFVWAVLVAVALLLFTFGNATTATNAPPDVMRLVGERWTPLHYQGTPPSLADAAVLADGRLAVSDVMSDDPFAPRPCEIFDPATKQWSHGVEAVPPQRRPPPQVDLEGKQWADIGDGTALIWKGCELTIEPGARALPSLPKCPERIVAIRLRNGALFLNTPDAAYRLDPNAAAFTELPRAPVTVPTLQPLGEDGVIADGREGFARLVGNEWKTLPSLNPERYLATFVLLKDGSVVAVGGMMKDARAVVKSGAMARKVIAALMLLALAWFAWSVMSAAARPSWIIVASAAAAGFVFAAAFFFFAVSKLAWH